MLKKRIEHFVQGLDCGGKQKGFGVLLIRKPFSTYDKVQQNNNIIRISSDDEGG